VAEGELSGVPEITASIAQCGMGSHSKFIQRIGHMIFRITQKLAKKIKVVLPAAMPPHDNPFLDWTANLFMVSRWQCILLTNSHCLYSVVMLGKGVSNEQVFVKQSMTVLRDYMASDGLLRLYDAHIAPYADQATCCKAGNRRVLGSMNDLIFQAKCYFLEMCLPIELVSMRLNETPLSMLEHHNSKLSLQALAGEREI